MAVDYSAEPPQFSILVNAFNPSSKLRLVIVQLLKLTTSPYELIINFDGCTDDSYAVARDVIARSSSWPVCPYAVDSLDTGRVWQQGINITGNQGDIGFECVFQPPSLVRLRFINTSGVGLFATASDNMKMLASRSPFYILVDDDQLMTVFGWNEKLAYPLKRWPQVFSVSMRCAHGYPTAGQLFGPKCSDSLAVQAHSRNSRCFFFEADSGNRGPLIIRASYLQTLGYLDEVHYMGVITQYDDHELNWRAYHQRGWISGFLPIDYTEERCCRSKSSDSNKILEKQYVDWFYKRRDNHTSYLAPNETYTRSNTHNTRHAIQDAAWHKLCS
jgi:glycosyltransferase involved in cell wall biosynthesis